MTRTPARAVVLAAVVIGALAAACTVPDSKFVASVVDAPPVDAPTGPDAPTACEPSSPCCDAGGQLRGTDAVCSSVTEYRCEGGACGGLPQQRTVARHCSGASAECDGELVTGEYEVIPGTPACAVNQFCGTDGTEVPTCVPCPGGCSNDTCAGVECTVGACCTPEGQFRDQGVRCASTTEYRCSGTLCGGQPQQRTVERHCTGSSATCDGAAVPGAFQNIPGTPACGAEQLCRTDGSRLPACDTCQFGCESNACQGADCQSGACCDGGRFADSSTVCSATTEFQCSGASACGSGRQQRTVQRMCSGASADCAGVISPGGWQNLTSCAANEICAPSGNAEPTCTDCAFGCAGNACVAGTLWVFPSGGQHQGDFGGRPFADQQCQIAMGSVARDCNRVRAILGVSATDSLAGMAARYGIPTDVEVRRPDSDNTLVAPHWNALIDRAFRLTNAVTTTTVPIWTGEDGTATDPRTCGGWTSRSDLAFGVTGDSLAVVRWLFRGSDTCNLRRSFACVCWSAF